MTAVFLDHDGLRGLDGFESIHSAVSTVGITTDRGLVYVCDTSANKRSCLTCVCVTDRRLCFQAIEKSLCFRDEPETRWLVPKAYVSANHNESTWRRPCIYIHTLEVEVITTADPLSFWRGKSWINQRKCSHRTSTRAKSLKSWIKCAKRI